MDDNLSNDSQGRLFFEERKLKVIFKSTPIEGLVCKDGLGG